MMVAGKDAATKRAPLARASDLTTRWPLVILLLFTLVGPCVARTDRHVQPRDFYTFSDTQLENVAALPPAEWRSTDERHLGKLLIPRPCESK